MNEFDVAIVGGGMVGASFALALRNTKLRVLLIESVAPDSTAQPSFDERTTALGNGSRQIFESLGVWAQMSPEAAPIRSIHVSDAGRFGVARLDAREQGVHAFGYVVPNRVIGRVLWQALRDAPNVQLAMPAQLKKATLREDAVLLEVVADGKVEKISAAVAVAADGAGSVLRASAGIEAAVEDYDQIAIVVNAATERPNTGEAFERFTSSGPLAVLPVTGGGYGVVWAVKPERAAELVSLDETAFAAELLRAFGWRAGRWTRIGRRNTYPLVLSRAAETVAGRVVLIGNAAQALHPVAGQGFNLGLRDAATLAEMLAAAGATSDFAPGMAELLGKFGAWRAEDRSGVTRFTDSLVKLFGSDTPGVGLVRNFGLLLFDLSPAAKRALSRVSWGFAGRMPRLARGLPLE
ncbi:MAG TPA: 2-octaprenyl-6-methoxyphenyl hydroxylase [Steroidobacteraceae bacterium]|jgi:2-octaprenyl-6-methoxyphenol hydroxylase|nr:2-octaprenyl-6-methoxyphenyl hydroxylase [Steroidobacteraceae bacterium]